MNIDKETTVDYGKKYLKYKKKYVGLKQKGGNVDLLYKMVPMYAEVITSLNLLYPQFFYNYINLENKNWVFLDCDEFNSNIEFQLFNVLNFNYETFRNFYTNSLYKTELSNGDKIQMLNIFFKNNSLLDESGSELNPWIIVTLINSNYSSSIEPSPELKIKDYTFSVEEFAGTNYKMTVIILPKIDSEYNISKLFFMNQLLYFNNHVKLLKESDIESYTLYPFIKIDSIVGYFQELVNIKICSFSFYINLENDDVMTDSYKFTKTIKKSAYPNSKIILKYNEKIVNCADNKIIIYFLIELIKKTQSIFNVEKYIRINQISGMNINLIDDEYYLTGRIGVRYENNYLNNNIVKKKLQSFTDRHSLGMPISDNDRFFFQYNDTKKILIDRYGNMKSFDMMMSEPEKIRHKAVNSTIVKNYIKNGNNMFTFLYKLKKRSKIESIDNMFYDYCSSSCINEFKVFFPNFPHTFYYFIYYDSDSSIFYNRIIKIIDNPENDNIDQFKQNLYLTCRYTENLYSEDDYSGIAIEEITGGEQIVNLIEKHLKENIISGSKLKTNDKFDYILWTYFIQIYSILNSLKNNFTHYDLHFENIIFKPVPNNMYVKINYFLKMADGITNSIQFSVYTKYIPVIIDYGKSNFTCDELNTKKIANILCENNELNKCNVSKKPCNLISLGINYSETSMRPDNVKNNNISQDLRYFALVMQFIIDKMKDNNISKTNLYIYKKLKKYKLSGWLRTESKYYFFKKVKPSIEQHFVKEIPTHKGEINNVESLYNYFIDFYNTHIKKILPKFEEEFKSNLYGTIYIDMTREKPWKFVPA
jgi:hypothetical protein